MQGFYLLPSSQILLPKVPGMGGVEGQSWTWGEDAGNMITLDPATHTLNPVMQA